MDAVFIQKKLQRLLRIAGLVRHHQIRYFKFKTGVDLDKARYYEKQLDRLIKEENAAAASPQKEIF